MKYSKQLFGVVYPTLTLVVGMLLLANIESAAGAAEFAALGVFFMLLFTLPITLIVNSLTLKSKGTNKEYYKRGMILPCIFFIFAIFYQTGLWDKLT